MFGIVIPVFEFDVLVERPFRAVGLVAFIDITHVVPSYLHRSPPHPLLPLLLSGLRVTRGTATVVSAGLGTLEAQLSREENDVPLEQLDLNEGRGTCSDFMRTS